MLLNVVVPTIISALGQGLKPIADKKTRHISILGIFFS